jgi:hypothetical protein
MHVLDEWLHYVDTEEVLPLFEKLELDYKVAKLDAVSWDDQLEFIRNICRDNNLASLRHVQSIAEIRELLDLLKKHNEKLRLRDVFCHILSLEAASELPFPGQDVASTLLRYLPNTAYLTSTFFQSQTWKTHKPTIETELVVLAPVIAKELILLANELGGFVRQPLSTLLYEVKRVSLQSFAELVELVALTIRSPEVALGLLLEVFDPETSRLLVARPTTIRQFTSSLFGLALDHIDEAANTVKPGQESIKLVFEDYEDGYTIVKSVLRVVSAMSGTLKVGDHVRLDVTSSPQNDPAAKQFSMDALVLKAAPGFVTYRCLHTPSSYLDQCAWNVTQCGSFVTTKTSFDAVTSFYSERQACCKIYASVLGLPDAEQEKHEVALPMVKDPTLNASQNDALAAAMKHSMTLIWGPTGTGKRIPSLSFSVSF